MTAKNNTKGWEKEFDKLLAFYFYGFKYDKDIKNKDRKGWEEYHLHINSKKIPIGRNNLKSFIAKTIKSKQFDVLAEIEKWTEEETMFLPGGSKLIILDELNQKLSTFKSSIEK